jgi:hypothetical protein
VSNNIPNTEYALYLWLKTYFIPDLQLCKNKRSRYDCYSDKHKLDIELKCRRTHYDRLLIEKTKFDSLISRSEKEGTTPLYINSTPSGIYAFYLKSASIEWELKSMPMKTDFKSKGNIMKSVGYLDVNNSVDLIDLKNKIK